MKILTFLLCALSSACLAQNVAVKGKIIDSKDTSQLVGVSVWLIDARDSLSRKGTVTDVDGNFSFLNVKSGQYKLDISYVGYELFKRTIVVGQEPVELGTLKLAEATTLLKGVEITGNAIQVEQKGDTVQYNANAFKTSKDASAEDLISKMPGMTSDATGVKAQGEAVQKVLVDGKEFFGDDAAIALKNLPADVIEKIEVFDRLSEQSQFTGFDDGQTQKTLNIVTKKGMRGKFGRVYGAIGDDGLYSAGGNFNSFKGTRRISLIGLTNNVNQQNFSNEDLLGVNSSSNSGGSGRGGRGGNGGNGGGAANNFNAGQQSGISTTHSLGLNYSDEWGKKIKISGSYFFNASDNERLTDLNRLYITSLDSGLQYSENSRATSKNFNHRFNMRLEYNIDSVNSIVFTPRLSFQKNKSRSGLSGNYRGEESSLSRLLENLNGSDNDGYNFSGNVVLRHRFAKRGRSISLGITTDISSNDGTSYLDATDIDQEENVATFTDQSANSNSKTVTISPNLAYTEPVGNHGQLQFNYSPSFRSSATDKRTYNNGAEDGLDTLLSNTFDNDYFTQRGGMSYRFNNRKFNFNTGINYQGAQLKSNQTFPFAFSVDRTFQNLLPQFSLNYKFSQSENIRIRYRSSTNAPSISQLQRVVDNRNPLFLKTGNPDLSQDFSHNLNLRYGKTNLTTSSSFLVVVNLGLTQDYVTNTSIIATADTTVNDIALSRGTQLSYPVNIDGYQNARTLLTYGFPVNLLKSNLNLTSGFNYNRIPALINNVKNLAKNYGISQGVTLSSNVSEKIDFTVGYTANYTIVKNSVQQQSDNNYISQTLTSRLNWVFWKGFVFTGALNTTSYSGLSKEFDQTIWYLNAGLGYKFLKDQSLEVKVNAFDLLNQNNSISRDVTETYIEDRESNVLTRYFMLTITYRIRS